MWNPEHFVFFWTLSSYLITMPVSPDVFKYPNVLQFMKMVDICSSRLAPFPANCAPTSYSQHSSMAIRTMDKCVAQKKPVRNLPWDSFLFFWTHRWWILKMLLSPEPLSLFCPPLAWGGWCSWGWGPCLETGCDGSFRMKDRGITEHPRLKRTWFEFLDPSDFMSAIGLFFFFLDHIYQYISFLCVN